MYSNVDKVLQ